MKIIADWSLHAQSTEAAAACWSSLLVVDVGKSMETLPIPVKISKKIMMAMITTQQYLQIVYHPYGL